MSNALLTGLAVSIVLVAPAEGSGCSNVPFNCMEGCYFGGATTTCGLGCIARNCVPVGTGYFSPKHDNGRFPCPTGTYSDQTEAEVCEECPEQTYQDEVGQGSCKPCPPWTHTNALTGQDSVSDCIPLPPTLEPPEPLEPSEHPSLRPSFTPSSVPSTGASEAPSNELSMRPTATLVPSYAPTEGSGCFNTPSFCMAGCYFSGATTTCGLGCIARICIPVGTGYFSPKEDDDRLPCPTGSYSDQAEAEVCEVCPEQTYQDEVGKGSCKQCPPGTHTNDLIGQDSLLDCIPLPPTSEPSEHPSLRPSFSPSSVPSIEPSLKPSISYAPSSTVCPSGYTGESCSQCCDAANMDKDDCTEQHFYKDGGCTTCPSVGSSILVGVATFVVLVCIFTAYGYMHTATPAMFYIGVDYLQILSFLGSSSLSWPRALRDALSVFAIVNFDIDATLPPECLFGISHEIKVIAILASPLIASLLITLLACCASAVFRTHRSANSMIGVALGIMYFAYLQLTSSAIDAFRSDNKILTIAGAVAFCLYAVSFPLFIALILTKSSTRQAVKSEQQSRTAESDTLRQRYGFLYGAYQSKRWYWSVVVLVRKLWLVCSSEVWGSNEFVLGCMLTLMFTISGTANYRFRPYMMLAQEMSNLAKQQGMDKDEDKNIIDDTKYRSITMRWNVDAFLHASLCIMTIIGAVSSKLIADNNWKIEVALSFAGLAVLAGSIYLLVWAIFSEVSRMVRFSPKTKRVTGSFMRRMSSTLRSRSSGSWRSIRGSEIVPSDEPQRLHIHVSGPPATY